MQVEIHTETGRFLLTCTMAILVTTLALVTTDTGRITGVIKKERTNVNAIIVVTTGAIVVPTIMVTDMGIVTTSTVIMVDTITVVEDINRKLSLLTYGLSQPIRGFSLSDLPTRFPPLNPKSLC